MTFLFDIGKVLLDFDFEKALVRLLPPGVDRAGLDAFLAGRDAFERGDVEHEDFVAQALAALGHGVTREDFEHAWRDIFTPNLPMWEVVGRLAAEGHRLLLFSNTNPIHCPWFLGAYDIFRHFEAGTYSFEVGSMKPEPAIYQRAIDDHGLVPGETLYIDDLAANIETGRRLGFRCHRYDLADHAAFEAWLRALSSQGMAGPAVC
jgi:putative hydrolase of the HAD superfamily